MKRKNLSELEELLDYTYTLVRFISSLESLIQSCEVVGLVYAADNIRSSRRCIVGRLADCVVEIEAKYQQILAERGVVQFGLYASSDSSLANHERWSQCESDSDEDAVVEVECNASRRLG